MKTTSDHTSAVTNPRTESRTLKRKICHEETPQSKRRRVEESAKPSKPTGSNGNGVITISSGGSGGGSSSNSVGGSSSNGVITISSGSSGGGSSSSGGSSNDVITISSGGSSSGGSSSSGGGSRSSGGGSSGSGGSGGGSGSVFAKYKQKKVLGSGGFGQVFAGSRRADGLPVAIKHIPREDVSYTKIDRNRPQIPTEVAIMQRLMAGRAGSQTVSAPIALLDWYDLDNEVILVLERPVPCMDMVAYLDEHEGSLTEEQVQVIIKQLLAALLELQHQDVFHRDIKLENVLIETGGDVPRVRIIDFGLSTIEKTRTIFRTFCGTMCHVPPEYKTYGKYTSGRATVWQLGVLLYESLHQYTRFETKLFTTKQQRIRRGLSQDCRSFLEACLCINPLERSTLEQLLQHPWIK